MKKSLTPPPFTPMHADFSRLGGNVEQMSLEWRPPVRIRGSHACNLPTGKDGAWQAMTQPRAVQTRSINGRGSLSLSDLHRDVTTTKPFNITAVLIVKVANYSLKCKDTMNLWANCIVPPVWLCRKWHMTKLSYATSSPSLCNSMNICKSVTLLIFLYAYISFMISLFKNYQNWYNLTI